MDLDLDRLEDYSAEELEAGLQAMDAAKQALRADMRVVVQALSERHAAAVVHARVQRMGADERRHLVMALSGIPSAEAVGVVVEPAPEVLDIGQADVGALGDIVGGA